MDLRTLKELVKQGEGEHLEFKLKTNHPDKIVRELVAFANSEGGRLLVGVSDDRFIKGLRYPDEDEYILTRTIESSCAPALPYHMEKIAVAAELDVLMISIPSSGSKPHYVVEKDSGKRKAFVRVGEKSIQASYELCEILRRSGAGDPTRFAYGYKERKLMQLLETDLTVTVDALAAFAGISRRRASETLIMFTLAGVTQIHPQEIADQYTSAVP